MDLLTLRTQAKKRLSAERMKWPEKLLQVPLEEEFRQNGVIEQWYSQTFSVLVFLHKDGTERLMIHRMTMKGDQWEDGITWDELMEVKRQCGRGETLAVEVFPKDSKIVNNGNVRHLWVVDGNEFIWTRKSGTLSVLDD